MLTRQGRADPARGRRPVRRRTADRLDRALRVRRRAGGAWSASRVVGVALTRLRIDVVPRAAPAAGARRHAQPGRRAGREPGHGSLAAAQPARRGVGHPRGAAPGRSARPGRVGPGRLPPAHRTAGHPDDRAARHRAVRPVRAGPPVDHRLGCLRADRVPAHRRARAAADDHRQRPAGRRRAPQLARARRRGLLRAARLRGRRRPAPGALALDGPPRRPHGPPGRAAVAGPGHRAGRRAVVDQHRRVARAGDLGRRQHRGHERPAPGPGAPGRPPTAPTRASPPATPTSRRSWSTWPASRPPTRPPSSGCSTGWPAARPAARSWSSWPLVGQAELERLARLRPRFGSLTIVQFDRSSWDPAATPVPSAPREGVMPITSAAPFAATWNRAARPDAAPAQRAGRRRRRSPRPRPDRPSPATAVPSTTGTAGRGSRR